MTEATLLPIKTAAKQYRIPYWLMLSAVRSGRIPTVVLSKRRLIPAIAMESFLAEINQTHSKVDYGQAGCQVGIPMEAKAAV